MPVKWSQTLIPTARQVPGEAVVPSHQLMLRAGMINQLGSGLYSYLPLGLRALRKAMAIVREEMDNAGAIEVFLPAMQPIELWEKTGRRQDYGENLFVVEDRHGREAALGPTHEEVMTTLVKDHIESYKQLPLTLYQIQTKFRDEFRPRFGVLRSREFQMKDAYSFDTTIEGLDKSYDAMFNAYCRIFERCGVPYRPVEAEAGPIGGNASHEFMIPSPTGEDTILESDKGNYAANVEKCEIGQRKVATSWSNVVRNQSAIAELPRESLMEPTGELEEVETPNCESIEDVCNYWKKNVGGKLQHKNMLKTLVCRAESYWVLAVVRGDHTLNEAKLRECMKSVGGEDISVANEAEVRAAGFNVGYVGPHAAIGRKDVTIVVDPDAAQGGFWVTGANKPGFHVRHFNWWRELDAESQKRVGHDEGIAVLHIADIRNAVAGDPSPKNDGGVLRETKGIEVGHVFKLGCKYSDALELEVLDDHNNRVPVIMGCYGIGVNRILAGAMEREGGNDDNGIIWPASIAPFQVVITPIKYDGEQKEVADKLAEQLESMKSPVGPLECYHPDVLIDDRDERPGVKFKDADLIGIPVRITIGDKALKDGNVEIKPRNAKDAELVPVDQAAARVVELLALL